MTNKEAAPVAAKPAPTTNGPTAAAESGQGAIQGEGDYESARLYDEDVKQYVAKADIDRAAHEAAPKSPAEAAELAAAEEAGKSRAR
jgi:hypothetical protein